MRKNEKSKQCDHSVIKYYKKNHSVQPETGKRVKIRNNTMYNNKSKTGHSISQHRAGPSLTPVLPCKKKYVSHIRGKQYYLGKNQYHAEMNGRDTEL